MNKYHQIKNLQNRIKNFPLSIKVLLAATILGLTAAVLPNFFLKWTILDLLAIAYPVLLVYFIIAVTISIIKIVLQRTKEYNQYLNSFRLGNFSLKKGIASFTISKEGNNNE
jgi:O-antigen/teichoic acid export membrane protein